MILLTEDTKTQLSEQSSIFNRIQLNNTKFLRVHSNKKEAIQKKLSLEKQVSQLILAVYGLFTFII